MKIYIGIITVDFDDYEEEEIIKVFDTLSMADDWVAWNNKYNRQGSTKGFYWLEYEVETKVDFIVEEND